MLHNIAKKEYNALKNYCRVIGTKNLNRQTFGYERRYVYNRLTM